jgi:hypothetical protein
MVFANDGSSARACSTVTPGLRRATSVLLYMPPKLRRSIGENAIGRNIAAGLPLFAEPRGGNSKLSGITPTTVYGRRSSVMARPTIDGSRPNARVHKP